MFDNLDVDIACIKLVEYRPVHNKSLHSSESEIYS